MADIIEGLRITESDSTVHNFALVPTNDEGGQMIDFLSRPWEMRDHKTRWRVPLHDFSAGLVRSKISNPRGYTGMRADASLSEHVVPQAFTSTVNLAPDAVAFRSASSATAASGAGLTITAPAGLADGDLMVLVVVTGSVTATIRPPTGWTFVGRHQYNISSPFTIEVYYRIAASEGASYSIPDNSATRAGAILAFTGADHIHPLAGFNAIVDTAGTAVTSGTIRLGSANAMLIGMFTTPDAAITWTAPTGMTERVDVQGNGLSLSVDTEALTASTGITRTATASASISTNGAIALLLAIRRATPTRSVSFLGRQWVGSGRYLYSIAGDFKGVGATIDQTNDWTIVQERDFGAGVRVYDLAIFENELVIALGENTNIFTMDNTKAFTQATDTVRAIALGVVDDKLWRAHDTNQVDNCITAPRTLANWVPANDNEYRVGNTSYRVHTIINYGGVPYCIKNDGVYAPDAKAEFHNQAPQMAQWPHYDNGYGAFTAWGYLWVPSISGLLRITYGESIPAGPEQSQKPSFIFFTRAGVEWNGAIYLLCTDLSRVSNTFICKMIPQNGATQNPYIYHEWLRLTDFIDGFSMGILTDAASPVLLTGFDDDLIAIRLGHAGWYHDDPDYYFSTTMVVSTGAFTPVSDLGIISHLVGVKVIFRHEANGDSMTIQYAVDAGSLTNMLDTQEGGGSAAITSVTGWNTATRYANPNTASGRFIELTITETPGDVYNGGNPPQLREIWAFGFSRPEQTHIINLGIMGSQGATVYGLGQGNTAMETWRQFTDWMNEGAVLTVELPDYEDARTTRCRVIGADLIDHKFEGIANAPSGQVKILQASLERLDYADAISD